MKNIWWPLLSGTLIILGTLGIYLYSTGYRVNTKEREITQTGMIAVKSNPDGAQVYLDGVLTTATNGTIQSLKPGTYKLQVQKNGFATWEKEVEVFEHLVTDITAILVSKTPRLEPLTSTGARAPTISPSLTKIAYFTKDGDHPGIWVFPLGGNLQVNLFKTTPNVILEDTSRIIYSNGEMIEWSPDEKELLVKMREKSYFLVDIESNNFESTPSAESILKRWNDDTLKKRELFLSRFELPEDIVKVATDQNTIWSPDEKKFLYKTEEQDKISFKVYDLEKPLPVGEKTSYTTFTLQKGQKEPKLYWYSDSFHLILLEGDIEKDRRGTISIIRIDGSNKTEIYNNNLHSNKVFPTPSGDKIVVLSSFKSNEQSDLYAIGIR